MCANISKLKDNTRGECCEQHAVMPANICCFKSDIYRELKNLSCKHKYAFANRKRLLRLSMPKRRIPRYIRKCGCRFGKNIEMVHLDKRMYTRTEQLAYPPVRKLLEFKAAFKHLLPEQRLEIINRLTRCSLLSLYSRLQNVQPPIKKINIKKWDAEVWKEKMKLFKKLSRPKKVPEIPEMPNPKMPLEKMKRFIELAEPVEREDYHKPDWVLTDEAKHYKPTPRIMKMYKEGLGSIPTAEAPHVYNRKDMLKYKATERTAKLALPKRVEIKKLDQKEVKENPFAISSNAKNYKASARITELAEPREVNESKHINLFPNKIKPAALKANAKPRTIELSKPKHRREKVLVKKKGEA